MTKCNRKKCCCKCKYLISLYFDDVRESYAISYACILPHEANKKVYSGYFKVSQHGICDEFKRRK